jgi:hypothetical protein
VLALVPCLDLPVTHPLVLAQSMTCLSHCPQIHTEIELRRLSGGLAVLKREVPALEAAEATAAAGGGARGHGVEYAPIGSSV